MLPRGTLLESPCHKFYLQLIEPAVRDRGRPLGRRGLVRVGLGAPDVPLGDPALKERGIVFIDRGAVQPSDERRAHPGATWAA